MTVAAGVAVAVADAVATVAVGIGAGSAGTGPVVSGNCAGMIVAGAPWRRDSIYSRY